MTGKRKKLPFFFFITPFFFFNFFTLLFFFISPTFPTLTFMTEEKIDKVGLLQETFQVFLEAKVSPGTLLSGFLDSHPWGNLHGRFKKTNKDLSFFTFFLPTFCSSAFKGLLFHPGNVESCPGARDPFRLPLSILVQWIPSSRLETRIKESIVDASDSGKRSDTTQKHKQKKTSYSYLTIAKRK